jgi:ribosomal protein L9
VTEALNKQFGTAIDRRDVSLAEPIKQQGRYTAKVKLGHGVSTEVMVEVTIIDG